MAPASQVSTSSPAARSSASRASAFTRLTWGHHTSSQRPGYLWWHPQHHTPSAASPPCPYIPTLGVIDLEATQAPRLGLPPLLSGCFPSLLPSAAPRPPLPPPAPAASWPPAAAAPGWAPTAQRGLEKPLPEPSGAPWGRTTLTSSLCALFLWSRATRVAQRRASFSRLAPSSAGGSRHTWARTRGDKGVAGKTPPCCMTPFTHLLHPGELEALLGRQGEGGVVLQEEEEVLLPAHLQQGSSVGLGAHLCPPAPPSSRDGAVTRADASTTPWNQSRVARQVSTSVRLATDKCSRSRS